MRRLLIVAAAVLFCAGQAFGKPTGVPLNLEQMARLKFPAPPLSAAEERVVRAAPDGTVADCWLGGGSDPEKADGTPEAPDERWPDTRNVRAELIRWLLVDREAREQVDPRGVWIQGARITGSLDLSFTNIPFPLALLRCRLEQDFDLKWAKIPLLDLAGSRTRAIFADGLKLEGSIFLSDGFHAEGEVQLIAATIGGDLAATGGTFESLSGRALSADGAKIGGNVFMNQELNAEGKVQKDFMAEGEVGLVGASIGGSLEATGGTFKNLKSDKNPNSTGDALSADTVKVTGNVFLNGKFVAEGTVRLLGAEIKGQLNVDDAWLDTLNLQGAHVTGGFIWKNIHKDRHPDFPNKEWKPYLNLTNAKVGVLADQEASWPEKGRLILDGFVYDSITEGPPDAKAPTDARVPIDAAARLKWLRLQPDWLGYRPQPYEQLIAVLRQMGHEDQVAEVAIAKQKDLYAHGGLGRRDKFHSWFLFLVVDYGYGPLLPFAWLALLVLAGTLMFLRARLRSVPVMVPSDKEAYEPDEKTEKTPLPHYYPKFNALVYSLDVIFPFDLGQKSHWRLSEKQSGALVYWKFEGYSLFQLIIGWVLLIVAAAVPAGLIK
jgi:hypothetical protein